MNGATASKIYAASALVIMVAFVFGLFTLLSLKQQVLQTRDMVKQMYPPESSEMAEWKTYRNEEYGFEVKYPILGTREPLLNVGGAPAGELIIEVSYYANESRGYSSGIRFYVSHNPQKLVPDIWFSSKLDMNGTLIRNNVFQKKPIQGGVVFIATGKPIPQDYNEPLDVSAIFLPSSNEYGVSFALGGQDHNLDLLGYDTDKKLDTLNNQILSTFKFTK